MTLEECRMHCANALVGLEDFLTPEKYKLSLVARYHRGDLADADIVVTADTLPKLLECVQRRVAVEEAPRPEGEPGT